jgi:PHD/YefM family antitoxin component YafN of YafNO toxin-antitoxin module
MIRASNIYSLTDFLRNSKVHIERLKDTKQPEVLTINGKAELVVQDTESYQRLIDRLEHAETVAALKLGLEDVEAGRTKTISQFVAETRPEYGL